MGGNQQEAGSRRVPDGTVPRRSLCGPCCETKSKDQPRHEGLRGTLRRNKGAWIPLTNCRTTEPLQGCLGLAGQVGVAAGVLRSDECKAAWQMLEPPAAAALMAGEAGSLPENNPCQVHGWGGHVPGQARRTRRWAHSFLENRGAPDERAPLGLTEDRAAAVRDMFSQTMGHLPNSDCPCTRVE